MSGQHSIKRNHRSHSAKARRRRVIGLSTSTGAFLAFGMTPLATAPAAHADVLDVILDPIINSLAGVAGLPAGDLSGLAHQLRSRVHRCRHGAAHPGCGQRGGGSGGIGGTDRRCIPERLLAADAHGVGGLDQQARPVRRLTI